jgi:hypothetical protein
MGNAVDPGEAPYGVVSIDLDGFFVSFNGRCQLEIQHEGWGPQALPVYSSHSMRLSIGDLGELIFDALGQYGTGHRPNGTPFAYLVHCAFPAVTAQNHRLQLPKASTSRTA